MATSFLTFTGSLTQSIPSASADPSISASSSSSSSDASNSSTRSSASSSSASAESSSSASPSSESAISSSSSSSVPASAATSSALTTPSTTTITVASMPTSTTTTTSATPAQSLTHSTATVLTTIGGQSGTSSTPVPSPSLVTNTKNAGTSTLHRSTTIAASVVGAVALLGILVALFFGCKRHRRRKLSAYIDKITEGHNTAHARARLLDGEDMDMSDSWSSRHYRDNSGSSRGNAIPFHLPFTEQNMSTRSLNASIASQHTSNTQNSTTVPHLLRARGSETGSIFHEGVWPPPGEESRLVDPLVKAGSHVDLSRIVDDIMGSGEGQIRPTPGPSSQPQAQAPPGAGSYLMAQDPHPPAYSRADPSTASYSSHSRDGSVTSQTGLLAALPAGAAQPKKSSPLAKTIAMADGSVRGKVGNRGGPPAIHWLKRSPRNNPPSLEKGE